MVIVFYGEHNKFQIGSEDFEVELEAAVVNYGLPPLPLLVSIVAVRPHSDSIEKIWTKIHDNTISTGEIYISIHRNILSLYSQTLCPMFYQCFVFIFRSLPRIHPSNGGITTNGKEGPESIFLGGPAVENPSTPPAKRAAAERAKQRENLLL